MRLRKLLLPLLALPIAVGGCGMLGLGSSTATPGSAASVTPDTASTWLVIATGSATPGPVSSARGSRPPALPPVSFLPPQPGCARSWTVDPPLIPVEVVPGAGKLTVTWPRQYDSDYRITAVQQLPLTVGKQPAYTWQSVPAGTGCTVTATITGLKKGVPYIVWLDAPNSGHERDGARHPYSGRSGVVYPG
jgi:hypothetical protein